MRIILHSDMNNFYASVECMLNPSLKGKPVAVCDSVEERHGIVLAKNYPAKAFGVQTGEAVWQARQKCHDLVIVPLITMNTLSIRDLQGMCTNVIPIKLSHTVWMSAGLIFRNTSIEILSLWLMK